MANKGLFKDEEIGKFNPEEIVFYKNGDEIVRVNQDNQSLWPDSALYAIVKYQPMVGVGQSVFILAPGGKVWTTSRVQEIRRGENYLEYQTRNSVYKVEYIGAKLEDLATGPSEKQKASE